MTWSDSYFKKITQAALLGKARGQSNLEDKPQDMTSRLKPAKKLAGKAKGTAGPKWVRKGRAVGNEVSGTIVCKMMKACWPRK